MLHRYSFLNRSLLAYATLTMHHHTCMQHRLQEPAQKAPLLDLLAMLAESADISANQMLKVRLVLMPWSTNPAFTRPAAWHACLRLSTGHGEVESLEVINSSLSRCRQGFQRVADNLADTALDNPRAKDEFPTIVESAQRAGWLESNFEARCRLLAPQCGCQLEGQHEEGCGLRMTQSLPCQPAVLDEHTAKRCRDGSQLCRLQARPAGSSVAEGGGGGSLAAYKAAARATIDEYFASGEVGEVVRRLVELDEPVLANMFLKQV
jgi:hypothetical protein